MISGAIQASVPTSDFAFQLSVVIVVANPKSDIFTFPFSSKRILSDFRSLWIWLCA